MAEDYPLHPRLGRPGDRGRSAISRYGARVRKAAARTARRASHSRFTGKRLGRGAAAARMAAFRAHPFAKFRMRRVVVKTHIARASQGVGKPAFRAHLEYIQRDGVSRERETGPTRAGDLYDRDNEKLDDRGFLERSDEDRHQFRIILSPEDAGALGDLKENTRAFMARMERDLGTDLDWVAVDHFNTGQPHTHIVVRGRDDRGADLVIARDYITHGMRRAASDIITRRLGPRRDMEIAAARNNEVAAERLTGLDRDLANMAIDETVTLGVARGAHGRFSRSLLRRRLVFLERLELARRDGTDRWRLAEGWRDALKDRGRRGDIIRSISAAMGEANAPRRIRFFDGGDRNQAPVLGRVAVVGPDDELRDTRYLVVEDIHGAHWHVPGGANAHGATPPVGAIVELAPAPAAPRPSDRTIARVAAACDGLYTDAAHAADDPASSPGFRAAHQRRLEALRRAGIAQRNPDGAWRVPDDFLERAAAFEARRSGEVQINVKSWLALDELPKREALTWLDEPAPPMRGAGEFANAMHEARAARRQFLEQTSMLSTEKTELTAADRDRLRAGEQARWAAAEVRRSGRSFRESADGSAVAGIYERPVNLAGGRFALIGMGKEFTLVPWRPELERHRTRSMTIRRAEAGVQWTLETTRGVSR